MGIVEKAFGEGIKTELVTFEQYQKMSDFYKFIIQKYFEIIPVAQQVWNYTMGCYGQSCRFRLEKGTTYRSLGFEL
mgnify:CR=1 FL=1